MLVKKQAPIGVNRDQNTTISSESNNPREGVLEKKIKVSVQKPHPSHVLEFLCIGFQVVRRLYGS